MFINGTKFQFIFRKYLYLPWRQEELEYQQDEVRLKCLMFEIVFLAKDQTFPLSFIDFCLMTAFYSIATHNSCLCYKIAYREDLVRIDLKGSGIQGKLTFGILDPIVEEGSKQKELFDLEFIILIDGNLFLDQCFVWDVIVFVECSKETIQMVQQKEFGIKLSYQVLIGLNFNGLHFIKPENRTWLGRIDFKLITEIKSFPIEFVCKINDCNLKFKTQTPYEIKHLILEYQQINEILNS